MSPKLWHSGALLEGYQITHSKQRRDKRLEGEERAGEMFQVTNTMWGLVH